MSQPHSPDTPEHSGDLAGYHEGELSPLAAEAEEIKRFDIFLLKLEYYF
ncbi:hypothetical protein [Nodularia sphaerocarpa]|nr:hypothetical protein [Nodularia sphaerocarpa]MDB9374667.1 hypothetical protein [Nodularia sphaerocarpa CS-585]MDB9377752.1 hypothetical protein [Nodularia sphaerocarpa CS-585A2]